MDFCQGDVAARVIFLFLTHNINKNNPPVKIHQYIPKGSGIMAQTQILPRGSNSIIKQLERSFLCAIFFSIRCIH